MRYLESIAFIIVFVFGNIGNWIWKNHMNKVFWISLSALWLYNFYNWYLDPSGTWERFTINIQNPWYYIPICLILSMPIVFLIIIKIMERKVKKETRAIIKEMAKGIAKSAIETALMRGDTLPNDEEINKYYKMYCKKFEMDNRDQWNTAEPMSFEFWEKCAKDDFEEEQVGRVKWDFMIAKTCDMFSFDPVTGQSTMTRFCDYEKMIDKPL
jgi:hypothetical protein